MIEITTPSMAISDKSKRERQMADYLTREFEKAISEHFDGRQVIVHLTMWLPKPLFFVMLRYRNAGWWVTKQDATQQGLKVTLTAPPTFEESCSAEAPHDGHL